MRAKFSIGLLVMAAFGALGMFICAYSMLIGCMVILGTIAGAIMYFASLVEPNEMDKYLSDIDEQLDEEEAHNKKYRKYL